jgi:hypothetical protein
MLYGETIAVCSEIHTKYINILCGQNVEFLKLNLAVHKTADTLKGFNTIRRTSTNSPHI